MCVSETGALASIGWAIPKDGEKHKFSAILSMMPDDEAKAFGSKQNRSRELDHAFEGRNEALVDGGKLFRQQRGGNVGWEIWFVPHAPQNTEEEQTKH
jgi:hypothetical protein